MNDNGPKTVYCKVDILIDAFKHVKDQHHEIVDQNI